MNRIIVIDDDETHLFITKTQLERTGKFESIVCYEDGEKAFNEINSLNTLPDCIILDLNMPNWSGWDFLNAFEEVDFPSKISIYIVTSSSLEMDMTRAQDHPLVDGYFEKPFTKEMIAQLIES